MESSDGGRYGDKSLVHRGTGLKSPPLRRNSMARLGLGLGLLTRRTHECYFPSALYERLFSVCAGVKSRAHVVLFTTRYT